MTTAAGARTIAVTRLDLPGVGTLEFDRDRGSGALLAIRGGGRDYLVVAESGECVWPGVCRSRDERETDGMTRHLETAYGSWREHYRWQGRLLVEVDGVEIRRDGDGRVIACLPGGADPAPAGHRWFYSHGTAGVVHVAGPFGARHVGRGPDGRVLDVEEHGLIRSFGYDSSGRRLAAVRPAADYVDETGRRWVTYAPDGSVASVYLWDGSRCLARIDGGVGDPPAAVFSLDPSATPVRIVTPARMVRVPRDAYGEGLLAHPGVPGLFGGRQSGGLVHLPLRQLDPATASFCEPDPWDGADDDPRRIGGYEGPLLAERDPLSAYEVCRGDPVGRADPTGAVSAGLIISDLTWSFQNNILTFFGLDWWFNLFGSLIIAPFKNVPSSPITYDFFSSAGISAASHGGFGIRRDGIVAAITGGRAFTTQHLVWLADSGLAELDRGEVIDLGTAPVTFTHYGTILAIAPAGQPRGLLQSMSLVGRNWTQAGSLPAWTRHGGVGVPAAPGTVLPAFPGGGLHLDMPLTATRGDTGCPVTELAPGVVATGTLEPRTFLAAAATTSLSGGERLLVSDGTGLAIASVLAVVAAGSGQRIQLDADVPGLGTTGLSITPLSAAPLSSEPRGAGAVANSLDVHGTAVSYAANDLVRLTSGANVTVARIARIEAQLPLDRPLPADFTGPIAITRGVVGAGAVQVTMAGADLDFGTATPPAVGSTGLVSGGGTDVAVRIQTHGAGAVVTLDVALPPVVTGAASISFRPVNPGTVLGTRGGDAEAGGVLTYTPTTAGAALDGSGGTVAVRCDAGGTAQLRLVSGPPVYDVVVLDRAIIGAAPFTTERFGVTGGAVGGLTRADVTALAVPDPAPFAAAAAVFLTKVAGAPPTAAAAALVGVDVVAGRVTTNPTAVTSALDVGRPVLVGTRASVVKTIRITLTFTRGLDLGASGLRLVVPAMTGHAYQAQVTGAAEIVVQPAIQLGGASVPVPFLRVLPGDLVGVQDGAIRSLHRVSTVDGGRIGLVDGPPLTAGHAVTVQQITLTDPGTGGPYVGIDGTRTGTGPTTTATFSVWSTAAFAAGSALVIVDGAVSHPAEVAAGTQPLELSFGEAFDVAGVTVARVVRVADRFLPTLARDAGVLLLDGAAGNLATAPGESIVAVAYTPVGAEIPGTLGPGSLLVPDHEDVEVSRRQSLVDHELTHTLQYATWGPLWFNAFPMFALELPGILATDTELPEFSRFLAGTVEPGTGSQWRLTIPDTAGVAITADDTLQVVQGARRASVKVVSISGSVFNVRVDGSGTPPTGQVSTRKRQRSSVFDVIFAILDLLTHGGLVNTVAGSTWGGIFWLLGKAGYGIYRAFKGTGNLYPGTVQAGGGAITLTSEAGPQQISAAGRIVVRQGDSTLVRAMTRAANVITLTEGVAFTGDVQVAMYDTHDAGSAFDWHDYFPATVNAANPFSITLDPIDGSSLTLAPEDRVTIAYRDHTFRTDVLAVTGQAAELADPITIVGDEHSLRIAKIGQSDPLGNADSAAMIEMGLGWMRWIFDPYGQIAQRLQPREEWARWLLRVMRWLLGTQNFTLLPFGYVWWRRLFPIEAEHLAPIEQEASGASGDLYSPLGRLTGQMSGDGFARARMVVGDVARYRHWPLDRFGRTVQSGRLDRPPLGLDPSPLRFMPNRDPAGAGTLPPNGAVTVGATADPGTFVAEPFTRRDTDPRLIPSADPLGFDVSELGKIPVGPRVQRMTSGYVAFTRPGDHRATTVNSIFGAAEAADASKKERQTLFFDIAVSDVVVRVAGRVIDASAPGTSDRVRLVPFQIAAVALEPNGSRVYRVSVPDPQGPVRVDGNRSLVGVSASAASLPVEVSRFYAVTDGRYGPGGLAFAGLHLSREMHIPVRRFSVEVLATIPLRNAPEPAAAEASTLAVGSDGFLLIPAPIVQPPAVTSIGGVAPAPGTANPISHVDAPAAAAFLGTSGAAFGINFPAGSTPGLVVVTVRVGAGGSTADLTCTFTLV